MILLLIAIVFLSIVTFFLFGLDKKRAVRHQWRIPETMLLFFSFFLGGIGGLLGMVVFHHKTRKLKFRILVPLFAVLQVFLAVFLLWTLDYYHADRIALEAMKSDDNVTVETTSTGWLFDGPTDDTAFIFYPGGKVEAQAYAPMLRELAKNGMDSFLVKMPMNLAFMGKDSAGKIIAQNSYRSYYLGGHSLGGVAAADFAASHEVTGLILLASYPVKKLDKDTLLIYGTEDQVVSKEKIDSSKELIVGEFTEYTIQGGNHAQFGNYGKQKGDSTALLSAEDQQKQVVDQILEMTRRP